MTKPLRFAFLVCALLLTFSNKVFAQDMVTDCDKYAASDTDPAAKALGVPIDKVNSAQAVRACKAAVQQFPNSARLLFQLGRAYQKADNAKLALDYYGKAAQQNYAAAQESLGDMYSVGFLLEGQFGVQDDRQAADWYRKAAEHGSPTAQRKLSGRSVSLSAQGPKLSDSCD
jgi:uncharacterized protein